LQKMDANNCFSNPSDFTKKEELILKHHLLCRKQEARNSLSMTESNMGAKQPQKQSTNVKDPAKPLKPKKLSLANQSVKKGGENNSECGKPSQQPFAKGKDPVKWTKPKQNLMLHQPTESENKADLIPSSAKMTKDGKNLKPRRERKSISYNHSRGGNTLW